MHYSNLQSKIISFDLFPDINNLDKFFSWKQCYASMKSNMLAEVSRICEATNMNGEGEIVNYCNETGNKINQQVEALKESIMQIDQSVTKRISEKICSEKDEFKSMAGVIPNWNVNLYKLIILSFLAGFSEQLVPNMLNKTKSKINDGV
jgi:hypothetical protein